MEARACLWDVLIDDKLVEEPGEGAVAMPPERCADDARVERDGEDRRSRRAEFIGQPLGKQDVRSL